MDNGEGFSETWLMMSLIFLQHLSQSLKKFSCGFSSSILQNIWDICYKKRGASTLDAFPEYFVYFNLDLPNQICWRLKSTIRFQWNDVLSLDCRVCNVWLSTKQHNSWRVQRILNHWYGVFNEEDPVSLHCPEKLRNWKN